MDGNYVARTLCRLRYNLQCHRTRRLKSTWIWHEEVNGKDVSSASHEDTIAAFTRAEEPILVEVLKRPPMSNDLSYEPVSICHCNTSTQTEWTGAWEAQALSMMPVAQNNFLPPPISQSYLSNEPHYSTIAGEPEVDEEDGCDVEYEEVLLYRIPSAAKLGLTLCYRAADDPDTDIYISEIDSESIAGKDGRIQEGDQLLQINGVEVRSREQAVHLFSEKRSDFNLLLARPHIPVEDYYLDDHATGFSRVQGFGTLLEQEEEEATTDTGTTENAHLEKDSGVGRTDESTKNYESSDHDAVDTCSFSGDANMASNMPSRFPHNKGINGCADDPVFQDEIQKFRVHLASKGMNLAPLCRFQSDTSLDREMALLNKEMENIQLECESLVHRHLESQHKTTASVDNRCQLEHVYVNIEDFKNKSNISTPTPVLPLNKKESVERWVNSMVVGKKGHVEDRDSSSAYNTADSSGSLPLTLELTPMSIKQGEMYGSVMSLLSPKMEDKETQLRESDVASMFSCDSCRRCCKALVEREGSVVSSITRNVVMNNNSYVVNNAKKMPHNKEFQKQSDFESSVMRQKGEGNRNDIPFCPSPNTMYTNQANLQHTIWLQQEMLRQSLAQQNINKSCSSNSVSSATNSSGSRGAGVNARHNNDLGLNKGPAASGNSFVNNGHHMSSSPSKSGTLTTVKEEEEMKMEWKVKRRADGTRYITRRPVRNRLLKARAMKILEERAGVTTDDDAASELKIGRYWSKEERKRHLERARDRKKKEMVIRTKMASVKEQCEDFEEVGTKKEINILELSHKKMMKRRGKVVFDDFTTVQEVLAHGSKISNPGGKPLGLLTVTTV